MLPAQVEVGSLEGDFVPVVFFVQAEWLAVAELSHYLVPPGPVFAVD